MVKTVVVGIWVCLVTLAAVYFSVDMATKPKADPEAEKKPAIEMVKGESITVPVLKDGEVLGYFIGRVSFLMDKEKLQGVELPMTEYMTDEMFSLLVGSKMVNLSDPTAFKLDEYKKMIREDLNKRLGDEYVKDVLVEQLDYMSKEDIRVGQAGGKPNPPQQIVKPEKPPAAEGEGGAGAEGEKPEGEGAPAGEAPAGGGSHG